MKTTRLSDTNRCPVCSATLSAATSVDGDHAPEEGDLTVCVYCEAPLRFTESLGLALLTVADIARLSRDQLGLLIRTRLAIRARAAGKGRRECE